MSRAREGIGLTLAKLDEALELVRAYLTPDHRDVALELSQGITDQRITLEVLDTALALEATELAGAGDPRGVCPGCNRPARDGHATCGEAWCRSVVSSRRPA